MTSGASPHPPSWRSVQRMDACLNSRSVGTPAIPLAYSRKFAPLLADLGWTRCVDLRNSADPVGDVLADMQDEHALETELSASLSRAHQLVTQVEASLGAIGGGEAGAIGRMGKPAASRSLGSVAARGAVITTVGQGLRLAIQMVSIMVMARLLTPTDYGLVAMVMVIISLGEVFRDFGLSAAAIQSPVLTKGQRNNLFWANAAIGVCLAAAAIALSAWSLGSIPNPRLRRSPRLSPRVRV